MTQNITHLPSQLAALVGQLAGLREEQKSINTSLDFMRQRRAALVSQQSELEKRRAEEIDNFIDNIQDPKTTPAYASLVARREQLRSDKDRMLTELRPKHPDVIMKQAELDNVQREINEMVADYKQRIEERRKRLEGASDPRQFSLKDELQKVEGDMAVVQKRLAINDQQTAEVTSRLGGMPPLRSGSNPSTATTNGQDCLRRVAGAEREGEAHLGRDSNSQGESIEVIDAANLPQQPVAPKRPLLMLLGLSRASAWAGFRRRL